MAELQKTNGSKTKLPSVGVIAARKALADIKERASQGIAEDQRLLVQIFVSQGNASTPSLI